MPGRAQSRDHIQDSRSASEGMTLFCGHSAPTGNYSAIACPEPPNSEGKSRILGRPSFIGRTVSA